MNSIILLTDYQNRFSTKIPATPHSSGMDKELLEMEFLKFGYEIFYQKYTEIDFRNFNYKNKLILYTSSSDPNLLYKNFIEDIILGLDYQGAIVIPEYKFLRAHHNKVFMEILRDLSNFEKAKNISSKYFGTFEDLVNYKKINTYGVYKTAAGSGSKGVNKYNSIKELLSVAKKLGRSRSYMFELRELLRTLRYKGYMSSSLYRRKFVLQNFIPALDKDWKILIFGQKYYVLERSVRKNDFRASGSGIFKFTTVLPEGILDFAKDFYESMRIPFLSLDIAFDGTVYYIIEFQAVYFGTLALTTSPFYFIKNNKTWNIINEKSVLETVFAESIVNYLNVCNL